MASLARFISRKLKVKVNETKSASRDRRSEDFLGSASRAARCQTSNRAGGRRAAQAANPVDHATGQERFDGDDDGNAGAFSTGLAWLLRRETPRVFMPHSMGSAESPDGPALYS
jgi:hypothetical protein